MRVTVTGKGLHRALFLLVLLSLVGCEDPKVDCETPSQGSGTEEEVCIPGGRFRMGHAKLPMVVKDDTYYNPAPANTWAPEHTVNLRPFHLDKYEVTWGRYRKCVEAGICSKVGLSVFPSTLAALTDPALQDLPAYNIFYDEAATFCMWDGKRLPTEAEWERAARGTDGRDYPWGNTPPSDALLHSQTTYSPDPAYYPDPVGSHAEDVSPEGVRDMFANVYEWVSDWYDPDAYQNGNSSSDNPTGPPGPVFMRRPNEYGWANWITASGERVTRGNRWSLVGGRAWDSETKGAPIWFRGKMAPAATGSGFRCARDDKPADLSQRQGFHRYRALEFRFHSKRGEQ